MRSGWATRHTDPDDGGYDSSLPPRTYHTYASRSGVGATVTARRWQPPGRAPWTRPRCAVSPTSSASPHPTPTLHQETATNGHSYSPPHSTICATASGAPCSTRNTGLLVHVATRLRRRLHLPQPNRPPNTTTQPTTPLRIAEGAGPLSSTSTARRPESDSVTTQPP